MYVLLYCLVLLAVSVAFVAMSYVWICGLVHAVRTRQSQPLSAGRKSLWIVAMLTFGWLGAAVYWAVAYPRSV